MGQNKIFMTTDASDRVLGAVLSFGPTWESVRSVVYDSMMFKGPELNYPVHEKELLVIMRALRKWKVDLLGLEFLVYTDHKTLLNFDRQKDMSRCQLRWMEELSIYNCKFVYVKGEDNSVADTLSRLPYKCVEESEQPKAENDASYPFSYQPEKPMTVFAPTKEPVMCGIVAALVDAAPKNSFRVMIDDETLTKLKESYKTDLWCKKLLRASQGLPNVQQRN